MGAQRGGSAEKNAQRGSDEEGGGGKAEGGGEAFQDEGEGGSLLPERVAEVEANCSYGEAGILDRERIVETQLVADLLDAFFGGLDADHDADRVAENATGYKYDGENGEGDANRVDEASAQIEKNRITL